LIARQTPDGDLHYVTALSLAAPSHDALHKADVAALRQLVLLQNDPLKALAVEDTFERNANLYRLLSLYRPPVGASVVARASPEVSRRVLTLLSEMSPTQHDPKTAPFAFSSYALMLRLTPADGFEVPLDNGIPVTGLKRYEAMHAWIKQNVDTYRLKKPAAPERRHSDLSGSAASSQVTVPSVDSRIRPVSKGRDRGGPRQSRGGHPSRMTLPPGGVADPDSPLPPRRPRPRPSDPSTKASGLFGGSGEASTSPVRRRGPNCPMPPTPRPRCRPAEV
jgi:hypothetical protein